MLSFYEVLFAGVALAAVIIGELWSPSVTVALLLAGLLLTWLAYASLGARLAAEPPLVEEERRWYQDTRDALRHLARLFGVAAVAALGWRLIGG